MKKLMFTAAAALWATVGFSSIESANVVGYQNKAAENASGYSWMVNTFQNVDGSVTKLKDFALSEGQAPTAVKLYFLNKSGATVADENGRKGFLYVHPSKCTAANGWIAGWYAATLNGTNVAATQFKLGSESAYWANDVEVPYGQGFGIQRGTAATTLVFNGSVASSDAQIPMINASGYTWTGNVMPTDLALKDLALLEGQAPTAVKLYFLNKSGATVADENGRKGFLYVHPSKCTAANGWIAGWYAATLNGTNVAATQFKLGSESDYWANDVVIPAGQGFGIQRGTATTTLVVPSPLAD